MEGIRTGLKANTAVEDMLVRYLEDNASDILAHKIKHGEKTIAQCVTYITGEARKQAQHGCAMIADVEVFGWAIHFFEEDSIKANVPAPKATIKTTAEKPEPKKPEPKKEEKPKTGQLEGQMSIMDLLGGMS